VKTVARNSPAWDIGIQGGDRVATINGQQIVVRGDVILAVDGIPVGGLEEFKRMREHLASLRTGDPITVTILRAGRVLELKGVTP
jgi:S1-C subfamily serine protease